VLINRAPPPPCPRLAFHPTNHYATHKGQEEASVPHIARYGEIRLPKYL
jgi:hypothetical protein